MMIIEDNVKIFLNKKIIIILCINLMFPAPGRPPVRPPPAYPPMRIGTNQQAAVKRATNFAAAHVNTAGVTRGNLSTLARNAEHRAGLPPGSAHARQARNGSIYLEAEHPEVNGWGGSVVTTHLSAHPTSRYHPNTRSGSHHVKSEINRSNGIREVSGAARIFPYTSREGVPNFGNLVTAVGRKGLPPAYAAGTIQASVAQSLAEAYTGLAQAYPSPMAAASRNAAARAHGGAGGYGGGAAGGYGGGGGGGAAGGYGGGGGGGAAGGYGRGAGGYGGGGRYSRRKRQTRKQRK